MQENAEVVSAGLIMLGLARGVYPKGRGLSRANWTAMWRLHCGCMILKGRGRFAREKACPLGTSERLRFAHRFDARGRMFPVCL